MVAGILPEHISNSAKAREIYIASRTSASAARDWRLKLREARRLIADALRASDYLLKVSEALQENGSHMRTFRHLMAPPISQDQFSLLCSKWSKTSENNSKPLDAVKSDQSADVFYEWRDQAIGKWLDENRRPTRQEIRQLFQRIAPLIANQDLATWKRNLIANRQEQEVVQLLLHKGWSKLPSRLVDERASVPKKFFMHKTRFATKTTTAQEVDLACGLNGSFVLAMECKVTNDETNSVKRVNDIVKKANAWHEHWGSFVQTAALLQGVVAPKDVQRLTDSNVLVFWSHNLDEFATWLEDRI